jgi:hypothetical protein
MFLVVAITYAVVAMFVAAGIGVAWVVAPIAIDAALIVGIEWLSWPTRTLEGA